MSDAYMRAGVDVGAGYELVERIRSHVARTKRAGVMGSLGGFGGCFDLSQYGLDEPVLVSGTDGVGTKILVAQQAGIHHTVGVDCVAMCVNDIVAQGAQPLFFLDYIATGKNRPEVLEQIVSGVADGCVDAEAALIGGETAEMPGLYGEDEYDLAGFAVGIAEKRELLGAVAAGEDEGRPAVHAGDVLLGLPSSGLHSNGFSLVRKALFADGGLNLGDCLEELGGQRLDQVLLTPTKIYVKSVLPLVKAGLVTGISHVTGGGFDENLPRMLPKNSDLSIEVQVGTWPILPIFNLVQMCGNIPPREMFQVFNMGLGMVLAVRGENVAKALAVLSENGQEAYRVGLVKPITEVEGGAACAIVGQN